MQPALRELLTGLIDYAGLFPPARLPLDAAVRNYLEYRAGPDAWMLGRFVIQAAKLHELTDVGDGMAISALGRGGADVAAFAEGLEADIADIERCRQRFGGRVVIDVLETKPPDLMVDIAPAQAAGLRVFLERPAGEALPLPQGAGVKIRTGGLEAAAFPTCEALAKSLSWAARNGTPFKATAGLHHPFPLLDAKIGARMHGFVNVFAAGVMLACGLGRTDEEAEAILRSGAAAFTMGEELLWQDGGTSITASRTGVELGRRLMTSFGSCSFDEPRDDLRALGWM